MPDPEEKPPDPVNRVFGNHPVSQSPSGESPAEEFIRQFKASLLIDLIREIPDELFRPGRVEELKARVIEIVDARLIRDKVPIGRQLRLRMIESLLADIERGGRERFGES